MSSLSFPKIKCRISADSGDAPSGRTMNREKKKSNAFPSSFADACYRVLTNVPEGRVTTYKAIARALNCRAYRAVGRAMNANPYAPDVPCHRVVNSDGSLGGFAKGPAAKVRLLKGEGIAVENGRIRDFAAKYIEPAPAD